jgi:hypothetical protein
VTRIFTLLAWLAVLFMAATMILGLTMGDLRDHPSPDVLTWARVHRLCGVAAGLIVVFVNSVVVTYFIGTSRWCKEVAETYGLDPRLVRRGNQLKRRTFPWAVLSMLAVVGAIALGGAADPATGQSGTESWVIPHLIGALAALAFIVWSFVVQWNNLYANHGVIAEIVAEVRRIRTERGLDA